MSVNILNIILAVAAVALMFSGINVYVIYQNNIAIKGEIDQLISNQQRLLANNYLVTANNNLLLRNEAATKAQTIVINETNKNTDAVLENQTKAMVKLEETSTDIDHVLQNQTHALNQLIQQDQKIIHAIVVATGYSPQPLSPPLCHAGACHVPHGSR